MPKTIDQLKALSDAQLNDLWQDFFPAGHPQIKPLWWKIQCKLADQKLDQKYITKLNTYSQNPEQCVANSNKNKYHIKPGTQLLKKFKGRDIIVNVAAPDQFAYDGQTYKSLSAIATLVCGHKVSGYDFFGFNNKTLQ